MFANITIVGRMVRDAEVRSANGYDVAKICVATNGFRKDDASAFWNVEVWGKPAGWVKDYEKGQLVAVSGGVYDDSFEKDGVKKTRYKINADTVKAIFTGEGGGGNRQTSPQARPQQGGAPEPEDDLPF